MAAKKNGTTDGTSTPLSGFFQVNEIRRATDADFDYFIYLAEEHGDGWVQKLNKDDIKIWQKDTGVSSIKMAKILGEFPEVSGGTVFDALLDGEYRRCWDENVIDDYELYRLDDYNDIGYYSMKWPAPLRNRDFVNQRSWRMYDGENQFIVLNHSVSVKEIPISKRFIRGVSYVTGFLVRNSGNGCTVTYVTQSDPKGRIPSWIINLIINKLAPSVFKKLYMASKNYPEWKAQHRPEFKPWRNPEQNEIKLVDAATLNVGLPSPDKEVLEAQEEETVPDDEKMKEIVDHIIEKLDDENALKTGTVENGK